MLSSITKGFHDFWSRKTLSIVFIIFLMGITFVITSVIESLFSDIAYRTSVDSFQENSYTTFETIVTSYELTDSIHYLEKMSDVLTHNNFSFLEFNPSDDSDVQTFIIFGDPSNLYPYLESNKQISLIVGESAALKTNSLFVNDVEYRAEHIIEGENYFFKKYYDKIDVDNTMFLIIKEPKLLDWISANNYSAIAGIIENAHIYNKDTNVSSYLSKMNNSFINVKEVTISDYNQTEFIAKTIVPIILFVTCALLLSLFVIMQGEISRKTYEFTIHLLYGAIISNIIVRMITYIVLLLTISTILSLLIGLLEINNLLIALVFYSIIISFYYVYISYELNRRNLSENLRGENK